MAFMTYGYRPDLGDPRDLTYHVSGLPLKESVDLRPQLPACWDQGQIGSCTAFGITGIIAFVHGFVGSQLWLYYKERLMEHSTRQDSGAQIRDGIKVVAKQGLVPLAKWPYDTTKFKKTPPRAVTATAKEQLVTEYRRLANGDDYRDCLSQGHPFVIGISVFDSFETDQVATTGIVPMPAPSESLLGGHAFVVVGYTDSKDWICRNSWGTNWGQSGHFILPKAYLDSADLATDAWMISKCTV